MKPTALVTGAAGGIGYSICKRLIDDGYRVLALDLLAVQADRVTQQFGLLGEDAIYFQGDVTSGADRQKALDQALELTGRLDLLVNVAGVSPRVRADLLEMSEESYDRVTTINTKGPFFLTQLVARQMIEQSPLQGRRGTIVNISSMSAYTSSISRGEYCISKAGVSMMTKLYADRLSGEGVLVYEIRPGIIATDMTAVVQKKYDALIEGGLLPISRWGPPEDIAAGVSILASGQLAYSPGQVLEIDGGFHLRRL